MEAGKVVLADGVEPLREPFALALGEHVGEGPDVTCQGIEFGAVGQDGLEPELLWEYGLWSPVAYGRTSSAVRPLRSLARWP